MDAFSTFRAAINKQASLMAKEEDLFRSEVPGDMLWDHYLESFPPGTNPMMRERREYDCSTCRGFVKQAGGLLVVKDTRLVSIWDVTSLPEPFQTVTDAMSEMIHSFNIGNLYRHVQAKLGQKESREYATDAAGQQQYARPVRTWEHFYFDLPNKFVMPGVEMGPFLGRKRNDHDVFLSGLKAITLEALDTVTEMIQGNQLYRGEEKLTQVNQFRDLLKIFRRLNSDEARDRFAWLYSQRRDTYAGFKNDVIGTLVMDLSEGRDLEAAVRSYEQKVAPENYQRPTALITKGMVVKAQQTVVDLGIEDALERRFAVAGDLSVNDILFVNRDTRPTLIGGSATDEAFGALLQESGTRANVGKLKAVPQVSADAFFHDILPKARSVEVLVENRHESRLMSLVAPVHADAPSLFKWGNGFSWAYNGNLGDSTIRARVKQAGGDVEGVLRVSLSWHHCDDLDIHVQEPNVRGRRGAHIYYRNKGDRHKSSGMLDVDMNAQDYGKEFDCEHPVENVTWNNRNAMPDGRYHVWVHNYRSRTNKADNGFAVEVEFDGDTHSFYYDRAMRTDEEVTVCRFDFSRVHGLKFTETPLSSGSTAPGREVWGIQTGHFVPVKIAMLSPNHWEEGNGTGNRHWFFFLEGCRNPEPARGFLNEFLDPRLKEHRKVFEVLGAKMKTPQSEEQLSGLGFSSTQEGRLTCRVGTHDSQRTYEVLFGAKPVR